PAGRRFLRRRPGEAPVMCGRTYRLILAGLLALSFVIRPSVSWARPMLGRPNPAPAQPAQPVPGAMNPFRQRGIRLSVVNPMAPQTMTQYMPMPYPMPMPSYGAGMGGYGAGAQGYSYGGQGSGYQGYGAGAASPVSSEEKSLSQVLTASGVPNDNGSLRWPL